MVEAATYLRTVTRCRQLLSSYNLATNLTTVTDCRQFLQPLQAVDSFDIGLQAVDSIDSYPKL